MKKETVIAAMAVLLSLPLALLAAEKTKKKEPFLAADANGDGKVSAAEFVAAMKGKSDQSSAQARFDALDMNKDGSLSREEFNADRGKKGGKKKKDGS